MPNRDFPHFDETNAPLHAREALARARLAFGAIPAPLARYAAAPRMMLAALSGLETFEKSSLSSLERELLAMTLGQLNGCRFCLDHHRRLLRAQGTPPALIGALEQGTELSSPRLESLRAFIIACIEHRGDVPPQVWNNFREAGFDHAQALEVLHGISVYTLTTFANRLTQTSE